MFAATFTRNALWASSKSQSIAISRRAITTSHAATAQPQISPIEEYASSASGSHAREKPAEEWGERMSQFGEKYRLPRSVHAVYLRPLKRKPEFGVPTCDLQLRSYHVRNVEFMADFALRAAYYLRLPASGAVPLPRITERWTVIRSNFAHKKSQENFERITHRRLIQIQDGHVEAVQAWLAFLRKHAFHGVGMKANVWEFSDLGISNQMSEAKEKLQESIISDLDGFGSSASAADTAPLISEYIEKERYGHLTAPLSKSRFE
ncbi:mitochondrial 37S ribosomal protein rsm10 [Ascosphaera aggregata]|nr:mitochondrial 37S ribosomal protein rsm10 [Ascosphaera aggregata]